MKKHFTKILGVVTLLTGGSMLTEAQTISAPVGQPISITNSIDVSGDINMGTINSLKLGGAKFLSAPNSGTIFMGIGAGSVSTGSNNAFIGGNAGLANTSGSSNFFLGYAAGGSNTTGDDNVFMGVSAGLNNLTASGGVFIGNAAGRANTSGIENVAIGKLAGSGNLTGAYNVFLGVLAGPVTTSSRNIMVGRSAGYANTSGADNIFIGYDAGRANTSGSNNIYMGNGAGFYGTSDGLSNVTAIGSNATATASNTVVLGNAATTITGQGLATGNSGLKFANLKSSSAPTVVGGNKVLSVNSTGDVVLVELTSGTINGTNPVAESTWKNQDGYLYNNSTNGVVINGTGLDGNALIVKGGVLSKEVNVKVEGAESWPDYVFKPTYKRMSLEEVEKFISINGHLPNVASATEMATTGNNLNKTDIKLLEKVEELTLYLLDMKKANDAQSAEIQALKKQMSKLRKK